MDRTEQTGGCRANTGITLLGSPGTGASMEVKVNVGYETGAQVEIPFKKQLLGSPPLCCAPLPSQRSCAGEVRLQVSRLGELCTAGVGAMHWEQGRSGMATQPSSSVPQRTSEKLASRSQT